MAKEDKLKALDAAIAQIEKQYGKGSVMKLGDNSANMNVETVPTGSLSLDIALGLGGLPKGRIIEVYGPESSGKTTVALHCVAEVQKRGGIAGFIDAEHALDPVYARNIGVDIDNLYISQPDCGEQALEITSLLSWERGLKLKNLNTNDCVIWSLLSWERGLKFCKVSGCACTCRRSSRGSVN